MTKPLSSTLRLLSIVSVAAAFTAAAPPASDETAPPQHHQPKAAAVTITPNESAKRIEVAIAGKPFTSYRWDASLKKPVLYPLRSANGTFVTRGWPLDPRPRERVDHPHQVGLWFNYGDVNGLDFWGNSDEIKADEAPKKGTIVHRAVVNAKGGGDSGTLTTDMDWTSARGDVLLRERTTFVFRGDDTTRSVDRLATLTAAAARVVFNDTKEGMLGLRVARQLEQPSTTAEVFTDGSGRTTAVPVLDNTGITGLYISSEGKKGDDVWGTRGPWMMLRGRIGDRPVTLAILDHPRNPGHPTHWHARGYGLFAANPLGRASFTDGRQPPFTLTVEPNTAVTFRYRLLIIDGEATADRIDREARAFGAEPATDR